METLLIVLVLLAPAPGLLACTSNVFEYPHDTADVEALKLVLAMIGFVVSALLLIPLAAVS